MAHRAEAPYASDRSPDSEAAIDPQPAIDRPVSTDRRAIRRWLIVILLLTVALRILNYAALADGPCLLHHGVSDMAFFDEWAQVIADGDVLTDRSLHPLHRWHKTVAGIHFEKRPEKLQGADIRKLPEAEQLARYTELWDHWYGGKRFHQEPLYPYLLAAIRSALGPQALWVHVMQMVVGVLTLLLLYAVTAACFGPVAALAATGLAALCGPFFFFELFMLRASLIACFTLALVLVFQRVASAGSPSPLRMFAFGASTGIAMMLKTHFLLFGLAGAAMLLWPMRRQIAVGVRSLAGFVGGILLAFSPVIVRNLLVGAPLFSSTSVGAVTFANSNHAAYLGYGWAEDATSMAMLERIMSASDGQFLSAISATIGTHDGLGSYIALLFKKFDLAFSWAEFPNNVSLYFAKLYSPVLALLPVTFTVVAATALVGLIAAVIQRRMAWPLVVFILLALLQLVAFYSLARFRIALMVALLPFSGLAITWLWQQIREKRYRIAVPTLIVAALFAWWVQQPLPPNTTLIGSAPYGNATLHYYRPQWDAAAEAKNWRRGAELMEKGIAARPDFLDAINPTALPTNSYHLSVCAVYSEMYAKYAQALRGLGRGRQAEAKAAQRRADELKEAWDRVDRMRKRPR